MVEDIDKRKANLRFRVREQRARATDASRAQQSSDLTKQLVQLVRDREATFVSCYYPIPGEPNTLGFLQWALDEGIRVILPAARRDGVLDWIEMKAIDTKPGLFGIPEPTGDPLDRTEAHTVELMLIPACAVDRSGNRLGWGRGYFDRALGAATRRPPVFAVVHDDEIVDEIPVEPHDIPITGAVTPTRTLMFE